ncbi:hypothetical protein [Marinobacter xestospongiae]|uniref:hypothetical protein n=1 Tax=Marinobacter xestospongiae TaxID=994319 RepID=UPI0020036420|nr:hypothetical protein [Marinobacter xestospongiae]MCK7568792.1 hypothetical protein [Marinobacter xestospongiae]
MRSQWNDAEDEALQGLTPEAQVIYLRGFRRYMDYRTGVAGGPARKLSYRALAELIHVDPDWGSQRKREDAPTLGRVRARVAELERAGLVVNHDSSRSRGLVFKLPLADRGLVRPEKEQHREPHKEQHREQHSGNVVNLQKLQEFCEPEQGGNHAGSNTGNGTGNNTHLYNSTLLNSTDAGARDNDAWPDTLQPQSPQDWGTFLGRERGWAYHRIARPKLIISYQRWIQQQLTIGDMRHIITSAEANLGRVPDGPEYYVSFAESYVRERDRMNQEIQSQQQRGVHGTGASGQRYRSRRAEQDEICRQLTDPEYAIQNW